MTNTNEIKARIIAKGLTQKKLAELIGISLASLNDKINNKREFRAGEIKKICKILDVNNATYITNIFFC